MIASNKPFEGQIKKPETNGFELLFSWIFKDLLFNSNGSLLLDACSLTCKIT